MNKAPGFFSAIKYCLKHLFDAKGRARRSEFWFFWLADSILSSCIALVRFPSYLERLDTLHNTQPLLPSDVNDMMLWAGLTIMLPMMLVQILLIFPTIRRFHDIGKSGWYYFCGLIPTIGPILIFIWMLMDSDPKENRYGPSPKYDPSLADYYKS